MDAGLRRRAAWAAVALLGGSGALVLAILGYAARAGAVQEALLAPAADALVAGLIELGRGVELVGGSGLRASRVPLLAALLASLAAQARRMERFPVSAVRGARPGWNRPVVCL